MQTSVQEAACTACLGGSSVLFWLDPGGLALSASKQAGPGARSLPKQMCMCLVEQAQPLPQESELQGRKNLSS